MKKKLLVAPSLAGLILLPILVYYGFHFYEHKMYAEINYYSGIREIKSFLFIKEDQALAVEWKEVDEEDSKKIEKLSGKEIQNGLAVTADNEYMFHQSVKLRDRPRDPITNFNRNRPQWGEFWYIDIYNIQGGKLEPKKFKRVDIFEAVRKYDKNYMPVDVRDTIYQLNGNKYVAVWISPLNSEYHRRNSIYTAVLLDLRTGTILEKEPKEPTTSAKVAGGTDFILSERLKRNAISVYNNAVYFNETPNTQSSQWRIAKNHPKVLDILNRGGDLYLLKDRTDLAFSAKLLQEFVPEGQDIFEGAVILAENSIDGQEHRVNSQQEFFQYYQKEGLDGHTK